MTRFTVPLATAALVLGILATPAQAQEPPAPETIGEAIPIIGGWCTPTQTRPWRKLISGSYYLRSNYRIQCRPDGQHDLLNVDAVGRFGVLINGTWTPYSNGPQVGHDIVGTPWEFGQVEWYPAQDKCASNGNFRQYRFRVQYSATVRVENTSGTTTTSGVTFLNGFEFLQCGDNEPGPTTG